MDDFVIRPDPENSRLSVEVDGIDHYGVAVKTSAITERPLTLFLNSQEIVTMMTIGDFPDLLAVGYLVNQNMLRPDDEITDIEFDDDMNVVVVRTNRKTNYEEKLTKKIQTSGCAQGTIFGELMDEIEQVELCRDAKVHTSWLYELQKRINTEPSLYLKAGAIHGCVLCRGNQPLIYVEDVGRHNAVDKIAGFMFMNKINPRDKIFYTTGRLTSEMIIKTVKMQIPILLSRSGFTAWGVELARNTGLTLVGRLRGKRFVVLAGKERVTYDLDPQYIPEESREHARKAGLTGDGTLS